MYLKHPSERLRNGGPAYIFPSLSSSEVNFFHGERNSTRIVCTSQERERESEWRPLSRVNRNGCRCHSFRELIYRGNARPTLFVSLSQALSAVIDLAHVDLFRTTGTYIYSVTREKERERCVHIPIAAAATRAVSNPITRFEASSLTFLIDVRARKRHFSVCNCVGRERKSRILTRDDLFGTNFMCASGD